MEKRFYRSKDNRVIAGVCGGVAEYFNIDPTIVRIIWIAVGLTYGAGLIVYIIASIVMPSGQAGSSSFRTGNYQSEGKEEYDSGFNPDEWKQEPPKYDSERSRNIVGIVLVALGVLFLAKQFLSWLDLKVILPIAFIGVGALLIFNGRRNSQ